jgi:hypothetical protein
VETRDPSTLFVPEDFEPPARLIHPRFLLEPIGPEHAERDHAAWTSSIPEICATPGFEDHGTVPHTIEENVASMEGLVRDREAHNNFVYTVLDPAENDVLGCVYIYPQEEGLWLRRSRWQPPEAPGPHARVKAWVRAGREELLEPLNQAVAEWLRDWPFESVTYAGRPDLSR